MTFEQQVNEALKRTAREVRYNRLKNVGVVALVTFIFVFLLYGGIIAGRKNAQLSDQYDKATTSSKQQIDYLSEKVDDTAGKLDSAQTELASLTIKNIELMRKAERANQLELELSDAHQQVDQAQEKIKMLTAQAGDL